MTFRLFALTTVSSLFLLSCSGGTAVSGSAMSSALTTVNDKLANAASVVNTGSPFASITDSSQNENILTTGLHTVWTSASGVSGLYDGTSYSLKEWFSDEFDPDFVNDNGAKVTFVGRVSNAMNLICYLAQFNFPADATGLPANGTHVGTITSAINTTCHGDSGAVSQELTMTVTTPADTTLYDKSFSVAFAGNSCPFRFKIRVNSQAINIATSEDQTCDGRDQASAATVLYNKTTDTIRFTYVSQAFSGASGFEFYRGYANGGADTAYILGINSSDDGTAGDTGLTAHVAYTAVGKPSAGGTTAISAKVKGYAGGGGLANNVYNGCIDSSRNTTTSSATLTCTMTGTDVSTSYSGIVLSTRAANTSISDIYAISDTAGVGFTNNTDMF